MGKGTQGHAKTILCQNGNDQKGESGINAQDFFLLRRSILEWYDLNRRVLPWRALAGQKMDPYRVWLSEVMLQQTTVPAVVPYFLKFTALWPRVQDLARAPQEDVLKAWAGLGYYARARNLHRCAQVIAYQFGGEFPSDPAILRTLPGVGEYTAGAIASIAFDCPAAAMDGNVERVLARAFNVTEPLPLAKKALKFLAKSVFETDGYRPGDFVQALMDLGATVCTPRAPKCPLCPLGACCEGRKTGVPEELPRRLPKAEKPTRRGHVYWIADPETGRILIEKRSERGLLGGMTGLPTSAWGAQEEGAMPDHWSFIEEKNLLPAGKVLHSFTHFHLILEAHRVLNCKPAVPSGFVWEDPEKAGQAMPSVFRKAFSLFFSG